MSKITEVPVYAWVPLGELAVDGGAVALAALPLDDRLSGATTDSRVQLAADLRLTHGLAAVVVRSGAGDGTYPVQGRLVYDDDDGTARLAEVRILFISEPEGLYPTV